MELIETDKVDYTDTFTALTHFAAHHDTSSSTASTATSSDPLEWLQPGAVLPLTTVLTSAQAFHCVTPDCVTAWSRWLHRYSVLLSQSLRCPNDEWFTASFDGAVSDSQRTVANSDAAVTSVAATAAPATVVTTAATAAVAAAAASVAAAAVAAAAVGAAAPIEDSSDCNEAHILAQALAASIAQLHAENMPAGVSLNSVHSSGSSTCSSSSSSSSVAQRVRCRASVMAAANPRFVLRKAARDAAVTAAVVHGEWQLLNELQQRLAQPCCSGNEVHTTSASQCTQL
jgi:uncharacterized protein YdiU (UPF0061 family)